MDDFPTTAEAALLDSRKLKTFIIIGVADYRELLSDLCQEVPAQLVELEQVIAHGDLAGRQACAHALQGILAYFGCTALTGRLSELERLGSIPREQAAPIHAELLGLWKRSYAAIKEWEQSVPEFTG